MKNMFFLYLIIILLNSADFCMAMEGDASPEQSSIEAKIYEQIIGDPITVEKNPLNNDDLNSCINSHYVGEIFKHIKENKDAIRALAATVLWNISSFYCESDSYGEMSICLGKNFEIDGDKSKLIFVVLRDQEQPGRDTAKKTLSAFDLGTKDRVFCQMISLAGRDAKKASELLSRYQELSDCKVIPKFLSGSFLKDQESLLIIQEFVPMSVGDLWHSATSRSTVSLTKELLTLVAKLERKNLVHLDIHPGNMLVKQGQNGEKEYYLIDIQDCQSASASEAVVPSTINFDNASPEVLHRWLFNAYKKSPIGNGVDEIIDSCFDPSWVDPQPIMRADVYSIGAIFFRKLYRNNQQFVSEIKSILTFAPSSLTSKDCRLLRIGQFLCAYKQSLASEKADAEGAIEQDPLKSLCMQMLKTKVEERISAEEALALIDAIEKSQREDKQEPCRKDVKRKRSGATNAG